MHTHYIPSAQWGVVLATKVHCVLLPYGISQRSAGGERDSTDIQLLDSESHRWITQHYPRMPTGTSQSAAVGYQHYLIIVSGYSRSFGLLHSPVVYCTAGACGDHRMTAVIISDCVYISSYFWNDEQPHVFSTHLPTLISNATNHTTTGPTWQELPSPPVYGPTLLALQNHLLLVGGGDEKGALQI